MVVCGRAFIPIKMDEVWVGLRSREVFQFTPEAEHIIRYDSAPLLCGMKYHLYTDRDRGDGHIICRDCAMKAGFIW